ncbi:MAG: hypothetical protein JWQ21_2717 [Herminiimonas sp.]|nr:hypothetical protein [Herminiimonas sp.]
MKFNFLDAPTETRVPLVNREGQQSRNGVTSMGPKIVLPCMEVSEEWLKAFDEIVNRTKVVGAFQHKLRNKPANDKQ